MRFIQVINHKKFTLISTFLFLYVLLNLVDGERGLISYFEKQEIKKNFGSKISPKIIYGGSVNDQNVKKFSLISEIDGFLIGGASKSTKKFIDIIKNYYK